MFQIGSHNDLLLIIDVQSSVVRGSLMHVTKDSNPSILYTHNVVIPHRPGGGSSYLIRMALSAVEEIIEATRANLKSNDNSSDLPKHVSAVHFVLSSPWTVSQAKTVSVAFKEDTTITRAYISGIIWEERSKMTANAADDIRVIEEKVFDVRLNGYSVASWESKHTRDLGVSFVVSIAGGRMTDAFTKAVDSLVRRDDHVIFHSSLFLQHLGIQKIISDSSDYSLIHIHGELTDVAIIHEHSCSFFGSFPMGVQHVIRQIAKETKTTEDAAESTLNLIMKEDIDEGRAAKEVEAVDIMKKKWVDEFKKLITSANPPEAITAKVIISAKNHEDFFVQSLKMSYPQTSAQILDIEMITPHVSYALGAERLRLTGLYAMAIHSLIK